MKISKEFSADMLARAMKMLDSIGAEYQIKFDGLTYGEIKRTRAPSKYGYGEMSAHYFPYLGQLSSENRYTQIPFSFFDPVDLQASVSARLTSSNGKKSYRTHINKEAGVLEVVLL